MKNDAVVEHFGTQTYGNIEEDKQTQMETQTQCTNTVVDNMQIHMQKPTNNVCKDDIQPMLRTRTPDRLLCGPVCCLCHVYEVVVYSLCSHSLLHPFNPFMSCTVNASFQTGDNNECNQE